MHYNVSLHSLAPFSRTKNMLELIIKLKTLWKTSRPTNQLNLTTQLDLFKPRPG